MAYFEAKLCKKLYFATGNYHKNVYWSIGVLIYISKYPPKIANVRFLIIFVKLFHNRFLKNIFEIYLHCTVSTVGEMHEPILSIARADLEPMHLVMRNSLQQ